MHCRWGLGPYAAKKKQLIAEGKLDKYGRPNENTPAEYLRALPDLQQQQAAAPAAAAAAEAPAAVTPQKAEGQKDSEMADADAPAANGDAKSEKKKKKKDKEKVGGSTRDPTRGMSSAEQAFIE